MRKSFIFIAFAMVAALTVASCKNNRKVKAPAADEILEQKQAIADSVLSVIDNLIVGYQEAADKGDISLELVLSDKDKMVKPDCFLDPNLAPTFVTKEQKTTALGYYLIDYIFRIAYDMPVEANKEAIFRLAADVNYPVNLDKLFDGSFVPSSDIIKQEYSVYKDRNDLASFWSLQFAFGTEIAYVLSFNPELYYKYISNETNAAYNSQGEYLYEAVKLLAPYDEEAKTIYDFYVGWYGEGSDIDIDDGYETIESSIVSYKEESDKYVQFRNDRLK